MFAYMKMRGTTTTEQRKKRKKYEKQKSDSRLKQFINHFNIVAYG
jgi:hypothetical protein